MGPAKKVVNAITGLLSGESQAPAPAVIQPPPVIAPPVMPTPNGDEAKKAKRRSLAAQSIRQGRQSTILSDAVTSSETLG